MKSALRAACWSVAGAGVLFALVAAIRTSAEGPYTEVQVSFRGGADGTYVDSATVLRIISRAGAASGAEEGARAAVPLAELERRLEKEPWIRNAELFRDRQGVLRVEVEEAEPLFRVFTEDGRSFYVDSGLQRLPLNERAFPRLPVFTAMPLGASPWKRRDSLLLAEAREIVRYLGTDSFWMAQIEQCDYDARLGFVMTPRMGDHGIVFGAGVDIADKFHRLMVFYEQVLSNAGWSAFRQLDLRFRGQVVAVPVPGRFPLADSGATAFKSPAKALSPQNTHAKESDPSQGAKPKVGGKAPQKPMEARPAAPKPKALMPAPAKKGKQ